MNGEGWINMSTVKNLLKVASFLEKIAEKKNIYLVSSEGNFSYERVVGISTPDMEKTDSVDGDVRYELEKAIQDDLRGFPLHKYVANDTNLPITKIQLKEVNNDGVAVYELHCEKDLSKEEMEKLKSAFSGQLSDGWGEGFEQNEFYVKDTARSTTTYYYSPWTRNGKITIKKA
jgi:hypothetical protein